MRKEQEAIETKINYLKGDLEAVECEIKALQDELGDVILKRDKAYAKIQRYRRQRDDGVLFILKNQEFCTINSVVSTRFSLSIRILCYRMLSFTRILSCLAVQKTLQL